jgi:hypothetical protein
MQRRRYTELKEFVESKVGDILEGDTKSTSRKLEALTEIIT